jgi:hypothetical protein
MKCYLCGKDRNKDGSIIKHRICKTCNNRRAQQYYLKNSNKLKERTKLWKEKNKEKVVNISKRYRGELKINSLKAYSNSKNPKCVCCGQTEIDFLCLDHVNNNGAEERKKYGLGTSFLKWLKKNNYPQNIGLQAMCFNCNFSKRINGVCIHQLKKTKEQKYNS